MATKPPAPSDTADKFMLRLPDGMRDRIAEAAKANKRSMNAEIIARLESSLAKPQKLGIDTDVNNMIAVLLSSAEIMQELAKDLIEKLGPDFPPKRRSEEVTSDSDNLSSPST